MRLIFIAILVISSIFRSISYINYYAHRPIVSNKVESILNVAKSEKDKNRKTFQTNIQTDFSSLNFQPPSESLGLTTDIPKNFKELGAEEFSKLFVGALILWLTVTKKIKMSLFSVIPRQTPINSIISFPNGVKYQDVLVGDGEQIFSSTRSILIHMTLLYNGLVVQTTKRYEDDTTTPINILFAGGVSSPCLTVSPVSPFQNLPLNWCDLQYFLGMKVAGKRRILVPPELAFGDLGYPPVIPPNTAAIYDVELIACKSERES